MNKLRRLFSWNSGVEYIHDFNSTFNDYITTFLKNAFEKISWRNFDNDYFPELELRTYTLESDVDGLLFDVFFENQMNGYGSLGN